MITDAMPLSPLTCPMSTAARRTRYPADDGPGGEEVHLLDALHVFFPSWSDW